MVLNWLFNRGQSKLPKNFRELIDSDALKIVDQLQRAGFKSYLVGGCVRDLILGKKPKDFDIATSATPNQVKVIIPRSFIIGRRFRIVIAKRRPHGISAKQSLNDWTRLFPMHQDRAPEREFQITTFRREPEKHQDRINENVFGSPKDDALRRDFTINALFLDPSNGEIVDFTDGMKDIAAKKLKIIGDPMERFAEDPIRILRAIRFQLRTTFQFDAKTRSSLESSVPKLAEAKRERIREEFFKALREGHSFSFFQQLEKFGAWKIISPEFGSYFSKEHKYFEKLSKALERFPWARNTQGPLIFLVLQRLFDTPPADRIIGKILEDLKISKAEVDDLTQIRSLLSKALKDENATAPDKILRPIPKFFESQIQAFYCFMILAEVNEGRCHEAWKRWISVWESFSQRGSKSMGSERSHGSPRRRTRRGSNPSRRPAISKKAPSAPSENQ